MHEFGHAISRGAVGHPVRGRAARGAPWTWWRFLRTSLSTLRGTRPSSLLARHRVTGDPMPREMIARLRASKELFGATGRCDQQCVFALTTIEARDGPRDADGGLGRDVAARVQAARLLMPVEPGTSWELRFGHLVGYASTYYSYPYAKCVAADLWGKFFREDPGSGRGRRPARGDLSHGGARERGYPPGHAGGRGADEGPRRRGTDPTSMLADLNCGR